MFFFWDIRETIEDINSNLVGISDRLSTLARNQRILIELVRSGAEISPENQARLDEVLSIEQSDVAKIDAAMTAPGGSPGKKRGS